MPGVVPGLPGAQFCDTSCIVCISGNVNDIVA